MTSNIHIGTRNLLVKLKEIKFWYSREFAFQNFTLVAIFKSSSMQNLKMLQNFGLAKLSSVLQYKFQS